MIENLLARAGGGGSHSGGGSGGYSSSYGGYTGTGSSGTGGSFLDLLFWLLVIILFVARIARISRTSKKAPVSVRVQNNNHPEYSTYVEAFFPRFQAAWSNFDLNVVDHELTDEFQEKMALELSVLKALRRRNLIQNPKISRLNIVAATADSFTAEITASADDQLIDLVSEKILFKDTSVFTERWNFTVRDGKYLLSSIGQQTEERALSSTAIEQFSRKNGFHYDPDFGWLMLPSRGALFAGGVFGTSDINNHCIGRYQNVTVEMYSYSADGSNSLITKPFIVMQAVLPSVYRDILVVRREAFSFKPKGLVERRLESPDFTALYRLFADPLDQYPLWKLLSPTFMEKLTALPFKVGIEVVDSFLYFFTQDDNVSYDELLPILDWAFTAMR